MQNRGSDRPDRGGPVYRHAYLVGPLDEVAVQQGTSDTHTDAVWKAGVYTPCAVHEP